MSMCLFVGKDENSRFLRCTRQEVQKILEYLIEEKGVTEFWTEGKNSFENSCIDLARGMSDSDDFFTLREDALGAVGLTVRPNRAEYLGKWANAEYAKDIPPEVTANAMKRLTERADYVIAGMENINDLVSVAEYAKSLGKTVYKIFA